MGSVSHCCGAWGKIHARCYLQTKLPFQMGGILPWEPAGCLQVTRKNAGLGGISGRSPFGHSFLFWAGNIPFSQHEVIRITPVRDPSPQVSCLAVGDGTLPGGGCGTAMVG